MKTIRIVYFGTPWFAAEVLQFLLSRAVSIAAIVTQPDRPKGRSLETLPSPVKEMAGRIDPSIPLLQPIKASDPVFLEKIASFQADLFVVVAYGQILSQKLLSIPPLGCINVHASLLPKYRGAAPIQRALMNGEKETGIAIQKMVRELDAGDVIATSHASISADMTFGELEKKLCEQAKGLLYEVIESYKQGIPPAEPQDAALATYASKIELEEGEIDWKRPADDLHNLVRAFSPRPGAWCWIKIKGEKKRLKILKTIVVSESRGGAGELLPHATVACGLGGLKLLEVQPEGKRPMNAADWLRGCSEVFF